MQFIKRFGKQLGFVVLIGSAVFSASSASAQFSARVSTNTDVILDPNDIRSRFASNPTQVDLIALGGVHFAPNSTELDINTTAGTPTFNPFLNTYGNLQNVGGFFNEQRSTFTLNGVTGALIRGVYQPTDLSKPIILGLIPKTAPNPPSLSLGQYTGDRILCPYTSCVVLHYGYVIDVDASVPLNPFFLQSTFTLRNNIGIVQNFTQSAPIASPEVDRNPPYIRVKNEKQLKTEKLLLQETEKLPLQETKTEYLVVYSEQTNPQRPGVLLINWTEFPVSQGQTPTVRFTNSKSNPTITVSNVHVLRTDKEIPLDQLNYIGLPLTTPGFQPIPSANGILESGTNTPPVNVPPTEEVLNQIVSFDGIKDYLEIPNNENLNFGTGDLSISAWVKTTSSSGIEVILDKRVETTGPIQGYSLSNYNGNLLLQLADGVGNEFTNYVSNISIADGNWHHVAVTVDRDQPDGGHWYLDGVEVVGERFNPTKRSGSLSNSKPLVIGRRSDNPGWPGFFKGEIGSVRLDKRVLSSQEIKAIAANKP